MIRVIKHVKKIKWTGTTGGEVIRPRPHEVAESEEKDLNVWGKVKKKDTTFE